MTHTTTTTHNTYGYTGTLTPFEEWVLKNWGESGDPETTRTVLQELYDNGWDSYGIGYREANEVMQEHDTEVWDALDDIASGSGMSVLAWLDTVDEPTSHDNYQESAVGRAAEVVAMRLAESSDWSDLDS